MTSFFLKKYVQRQILTWNPANVHLKVTVFIFSLFCDDSRYIDDLLITCKHAQLA